MNAKNAELEAATSKYATYQLRAPALIKAGIEVNTLPITDWDDATFEAFVARAQPPKQPKRLKSVEVYIDPDKARFTSLFKRHNRTATDGG